MRKFLLVLLALVMMVGLAMAENDSKPMPAEAAAFEGEWQCDRATAELVWEEEGFKVLITWGSSAWETTQWEYSCYYHEEDNTLVSMPFGIRTDLVYDDNGNETSATAAYEDGQATFKIDEDGRLIWIDEKENAGDGMLFEKLDNGETEVDTVEIPSSNIYTPAVSEAFKALVGGKTFEVSIAGWSTVGEDEDARMTIDIIVSEPLHYAAADIENLKPNDILALSLENSMMVMEVNADEFGFSIKDGSGEGYILTKEEDGCYGIRTETENILYNTIFTMTVPLVKDISFLDWSDPENMEAPVKKGYEELTDLILEGTSFAPYNTKVTFDENGVPAEILYTYSPFN